MSNEKVKFEVLKPVILHGSQNPAVVGTIIETDEPAAVAEYKALLPMGYVKESTGKVTPEDERYHTTTGMEDAVRVPQGVDIKSGAPENKATAPKSNK